MSAGTHRGPTGNRAPPFARLCCVSAALGMLWSPASLAFNLDVDKLTVYSGPEGSYFGYSLDFYIPDARTASVLVGAPKANTSQPDIIEGGAVYYCPWPAERSSQCKQIPFDTTSAGEDVEKEEHSYTVGGIARWYNRFGNQSGGSSENWA